MLNNLKISQKGVILVLVPLVFELTFVGLLVWRLQAAEREARIARHAQNIITQCDRLERTLMDAGQWMVAWNLTRDQKNEMRFQRAMNRIVASVDNLHKETINDPDARRQVQKLVKVSDKVQETFASYHEQISSSDRAISLRMASFLGEEVKRVFDPFNRILEEVNNDQQKKLSQVPNEDQRSRPVKLILIIGVLGNILITIALALFFSRGITQRLSVLSDNSKRIANKEPLNMPLVGQDELTMLDRSFHDMAKALDAAEKRKQEFISAICHDLRAPLTSVQATLALAGKGSYGDISDKGQARFNNAERNIQRLIDLIGEMLDIEKIEAGMLVMNKKDVAVADILDQAADSVKVSAEKKNIFVKLPETQARIYADEERMIRVLVNLLSNAVKYSPPDSQVAVLVNDTIQGVELKVVDQGRGIPAQFKEKIFDRFRQVDRDDANQGTGLGLAICKGIVEAHQGQIGVDSSEGQGSTFWLRLSSSNGAK